MEFPHLSKAPIIEAVIDIQTISKESMPQDQIIEALKNAHSQIKSEFPEIQARISRKIEITGTPPETVVRDLTEGYFYKSTDGVNVLQFRRYGFTLSRVQKYENFDLLLANAQRLWPIYLSVCGDVAVSRLAVRYINQIKVPFPLLNNDDYLTDLRKPKTSPSETKLIRSFADQTVSLDAASGATVSLVRFMQEPAKDATEAIVTVDIDVFRVVSDMAKDDKQLWDIIMSFRDVKNRLFFGAVGKRAIESYI